MRLAIGYAVLRQSLNINETVFIINYENNFQYANSKVFMNI